MSLIVSNLAQPKTQDVTALKRVWSSLNADSCPEQYNFHMHTNCSDGRLTPERLIEQAINIGLQGMAITDHHSIRGFYAAQKRLKKTQIANPYQTLPHLWTGVEITALFNGIELHILGYAFAPKHSQIQQYLQNQSPQGEKAKAHNVITAIQKAGGLAVLAHPARYRQSFEQLIPALAELGIDGVEAYYAYGNPKPWQPSSVEMVQIKQLSQKYGLFNTCGTDTHGLSLLVRI